MWLAGLIAVFLGLAYIGRKIRLGTWSSGPWFRQFRAVRSVLGLMAMIGGILLMLSGRWPLGLAAFFASIVLGGSVRFSTFRTRPDEPPTAAAYSADEIQAYQTLGLGIGADRKQVAAAWKTLMKQAHPDQGGSLERAKSLNAARDLLMKRRR